MAIGADAITEVARAIPLALAPAFLLTAVAGLLNVMASRLARIIDRGRELTERRDGLPPAVLESAGPELRALEQRRRCTSRAITACTVAALLLCMVIAALFLEAMFAAPLDWLIGALFTASTFALVIGLALFLREVHLAMQTIRIPVPKDG